MYCGIDIGTSSVKCLLVDETGFRLGLGRASVGLYRGESGYEADPLEWLKSVAAAYQEAVAATGYGESGIKARLRGVSVSGNGPTLVAVGKDGLPVGRASSWMDRSAVAAAAKASKAAGRTVDPSFYLPKAIRALDRADANSIAMFFSGPEYLAFTLGADPVSYLSDDFYDSFVWDRKLLHRMGLEDSMFPPYVAPAERIGSVSVHASEAIGLPAELPIISGFPDFLAALVGSGTVTPGIACDRSGSSEALNACATKPFPDPSIFSLPHAIQGLWNLSGGLTTSGKALDWFSEVSGYSGIGSDNVFQEAENVTAGAGGVLFLPYLAGERAPIWEPDLRGAFMGLSLSQGRPEMARAVVESIAFGLRLAADRIRSGKFAIDIMRCSGGAARDEVLCTIKADVLGIPVEVPLTPECEAMGDACACSVALHDHTDLKEASEAMVRIESRFEPDSGRRILYGNRYDIWKNFLEDTIAITARHSETGTA